ncbi:MAG: hypothetical protein J5747_02600 [Spirochaetaceae bacterium]|nr:hypothetical protein [Spirochaetaceae bacterium]
MSYETVMEKVKTLPEQCLEAASNYLDFLLYQYGINKMNSLVESEEVFNAKMQKGYEDAMEGRCKPVDQAFADIKKRFA